MMTWLEQKYLGLVSVRLRNYKRKSGGLINFSCPFCGDSEADKRKARGFIYTKKDKTLYHCRNCSITYSFDTFLKNFDFNSYSEFNLERLKENKTPQQVELEEFVAKMRKPVFLQSGPLAGLKKISQLKANHPAKVVVDKRKIPTPYHAKLFYCPKFFAWSNSVVPEKFDEKALKYDESRLLIPFINDKQQMHAFQGRSFDPKSASKYITIVNDESVQKIYGLDAIDYNKKYYVFEGPIDSMFIPNSIATAGGDLISATVGLPKKNMVVVYDNEPRNKDTVKKIDKSILNGYNVCIWPTNLVHKDVNEMVMQGMSADFVRYIIDTNTHNDLRAKLAFNIWRKS
jgi:transcription elongation factor Elf1